MESKRRLTIITIIGIVSSFILSPDFRSCVSFLFKGIYSRLLLHPTFWGVMISWLVAVTSTFIVLSFAHINRDKKEEYKEIFRQSEVWLRGITIVILFYLAIHLASKAFCTKVVDNIPIPIGIPVFGESYADLWVVSYDKLDFFKYITPQDIFLSSLTFWVIILIFLVAPSRPHEYNLPIPLIPKLEESKISGSWRFSWVMYRHIGTVPLFFALSIVISVITALIVYFFPFLFALMSNLIELSQKLELSKYYLFGFFIIFLIALIILFVLKAVQQSENRGQKESNYETSSSLPVKTGIPKGVMGDFRDLLLVFCFMPSIIVASLVLAGDDLVKFPNVFGHIVVGLLLISGFSTLMSIVTISFKQETDVKPWRNPVWLYSTFASLAAISGFSALFLLVRPFLYTDIFGKVLSFSVAIMILILLYGFLYEKLQKYQFTEWWRREWRPIAMIISILMITIVSAFSPVDKVWVTPIPTKLLWIVAVLVIGFLLPWIIMGVRMLLKGQKLRMKLPMHQGMVLVKTKTDPDSLKKVVNGLDDREGVYQTMVVKGEYDVCLTVEGVSSDDIEEKILKIRKIDGVASTTTLTDIREFFDREVR